MINSGKSNKRRVSSRPFFTLAAFFFAMMAGLGFFRFSASQLEYRLSSVERNIERYATEEIELKQALSGLVSPIKIYSYCKEQLGMIAGKQETVRVERVYLANTVPDEPQKGWRTSMFAFFGLTAN